MALFHVIDHHAPPAPIAQLVTFSDGSFSSYGTPSFRVAATNGNAAPVTVHSVTVEFVNDQTGRAIATVTEQVGATVIPGGQSQAITGQAPAAVANCGHSGPVDKCHSHRMVMRPGKANRSNERSENDD